ncbi:hypothetical protein F4778DRAFT_717356 [Xylariomycetidae sp. FL2044]|nr:hypothetical protein F4778DRAFT_717356 [Xylariomycetidae sp. FL2044]
MSSPPPPDDIESSVVTGQTRKMPVNNQDSPAPGLRSRVQSLASRMRRDTAKSSRDTAQGRTQRKQSFSVQAQTDRKSRRPKLYQDKYPAYAGLAWETLHTFLTSKWSNETFEECVVKDYWVFNVPEMLTDADRSELEELRDRKFVQVDRKKSQTPEPP